jgi:hypothetical protein
MTAPLITGSRGPVYRKRDPGDGAAVPFNRPAPPLKGGVAWLNEGGVRFNRRGVPLKATATRLKAIAVPLKGSRFR